MALASESKKNLAILLLDFEKAYDRVDWNFLGGTLLHFGFPRTWIRGVAALYSSASSRVLLTDGKGPAFKLSRSVCQGCPLAPFLFLFLAEALSTYLNAEDIGLKGINILLSDKELLELDFANDISLFLDGNGDNLRKAERAIQEFCLALGARINWSKTVGPWIGPTEPPSLTPDPGLRCIPKGTLVRYLGCQIGIDLSREQQIAPLLLSMRQKLLGWSKSRLSLAGRVVVVNHVLLETMWYTLSCWMFSKHALLRFKE